MGALFDAVLKEKMNKIRVITYNGVDIPVTIHAENKLMIYGKDADGQQRQFAKCRITAIK